MSSNNIAETGTVVEDSPLAGVSNRIAGLVVEALTGTLPQADIESLLAPGECGAAFVDELSKIYGDMTRDEHASATFPLVNISDEPAERKRFESFPDVAWNVSYDDESCVYTCSSSFSLDGYEDYYFDVSVLKPELGDYYFVNKLSVCGCDIYHRVYSETAGELVDEFPVIGEPRFSDVLSQVQSEVEKATNGRYDETVLDDYWADMAENQYNFFIQMSDL